MTESVGQEESRWITTVIMSTALQNHEISTILQSQQHRVRYSDSVEIGSVIFSLSGVAFILADTQDLLRTGEEQFLDRIQKFINIHRNSFLVLSAALHGPEEWNIMFRIQRRPHQTDADKAQLYFECMCFVTSCSAIVCKSVNEFLHWWRGETCSTVSKVLVEFVKNKQSKQAP
ncbi:protein SPO16 homolog isoform X1 [Apteryx mantelli]|uniref:Protein SPO16 homolog isoform X1 n=1 Tax=Apteryx mantelli TaxID=2696672 RepID=A0A8B7K0L6_9AVES|nr:PREDICTED: uncharacterized protein C1orf146 homolog isoform X1 [Apteryx mantelli mantelli]